jgi:hypothetical protein
MKTKTNKTKKTDAPLTRNEFKDAISKLSRNELIGLICDIYYAHSKGGKGSEGRCECDCGCSTGSESKKTPKAKVSKKVK